MINEQKINKLLNNLDQIERKLGRVWGDLINYCKENEVSTAELSPILAARGASEIRIKALCGFIVKMSSSDQADALKKLQQRQFDTCQN